MTRQARPKGSGRIFARGGVWYFRYRVNGSETTRSTGVKVDTSSPEAFEKSKKKGLEVLDAETEILRLKQKENRLKIVKMMLEDTQEQIKDRISGIRRDAALDQIEYLFLNSSRRSGCSENQLATYKRYIGVLTSKLGQNIRICDIDEGMADSFSSWLFKKPLSDTNSSTMSPNSYNKYLNGYTFIWDAIMSKVGIENNPWKSIPRKKLDTNVRKALTEQETTMILGLAEGEMRTLLAIGLYTGLRLGDSVHLRWSDIHDGAIFVDKTRKTGASVCVPLHRRLKSILDQSYKDGDAIIPGLATVYDTQGSSPISRKVKALFEKCKITTSSKYEGHIARPLCGYHSLRSTFVTRCVASGIPQAVVQALVGHASTKMTQHYTHLENKDIIEAFSRIA